MPAVLRLVQGTGVWYSTRRLVKSLFVQLLRVQCVMPPVPERFFAYGGCDPNSARDERGKALPEPCHICSSSHMLRPRISSGAMDSIRQGALECARYLPPCKDTFATEDRAELFCRTQDRGLMPAMVSGFNCSHALPFNIDKRTRGGR
jgi:hypothetical protein